MSKEADTKEARCDGMKRIMEAPFAWFDDDGDIRLDGHCLTYCPWCGGKLCTWKNEDGHWQYGGCNPESPDFECTEGYYDEADRYTVEFPST